MLTQVIALTWLGLKGIPSRLLSSLAAVLGIAIVVVVLIGVLALITGFRTTVSGTGSPEVAVILREGARVEINSGISLTQLKLLADAPGIARLEGRPQVSGEVYVTVPGVRRSNGVEVSLPLRGLDPQASELRQGFQLVEGRMFAAGRNELVVGRAAMQEFSGLEVGSVVRFGSTDWHVTGVFSAGGSVFESELWADTQVVRDLFHWGPVVQAVRVRLEEPGRIERIQAYVDADPRLNVSVITEQGYYADQSAPLIQIVRLIGYPIVLVMSLGALAGALNSMYASVAARTLEIVTLRAIGFRGSVAFLATLLESVVLAVAGCSIGLLTAYPAWDGLRTSTQSVTTLSQTVFEFRVTSDLIQQGYLLALCIGVLAGIFAAVRAVRFPVADAFRSG